MERIRLAEHLLVLRCQAGDEDAFEELFRRFGNKTHRYLEGLLGYPAGDDALQDVWLTVYRRIGSLANPAGFRTWLFQVTRNRALDLLRRSRRKLELEAEPELLATCSEAFDDEPEFDIADEAVAAAMRELSPPHREALVLRFWEDLSYAEIALVVGASVGTVRSRLFHAKRLVRKLLETELGRSING